MTRAAAGEVATARTMRQNPGRCSTDGEDDQHTYSMARPTARQIDEWKQRLSLEEIESCRRFVEPFGLPYYPGFEPHVSSISGDRGVQPSAAPAPS